MRNAVLALTLLTATAAPACVHDDGRGTTTGAVEVAPDVAKGAVTVAAVALCLGFMYLQSR